MEVEIGKVTHYFNHLNVAVLKLTETLRVGETIHILGHNTDFTQVVASIEVRHHRVIKVEPDEDVALKVIDPVHVHDTIYRVTKDVLDLQVL